MAKFDIQGFDKLMTELDRLGRFGEIAPKMLEESVGILKEEVIKEASKHRDTGEMVESIKETSAISGKGGGYYICVRPTGYASGKKWQNSRTISGKKAGKRERVRNMEKLVYLEFGVKGRPATPVLTTAVLNAEPKVIAKMREVFNREVTGG
ncbi:HK97 gp10 family phage protein [Robinsoniella peoriensis]|uniref:HK97 gp10 family phage protein n=1 Tax=Robinsoniella peoriensis TaxID=180332 RepID=UPI00363AB735